MNRRHLLLLCICPVIAEGGGFELRTPGQKAFAMGGAFAAVCSDATAVYYNPGAMSLMDRNASFSAGAIFSSGKSSFLGLYGSQEDTQGTSGFYPQLFGSVKAGERLAFGLGVYSPFGYHTRWDDGWEGRYVSQESRLSVYAIQPAASYRVSDQVGVGAGISYSFGKWEDRKAVPAGNAYGTEHLSGNGKAIGFNAGVFVELSEDLKAGLTYRSAQDFKVDDGDFSYASLPVSISDHYPVSGTYATSLRLPACLTGAMSYRFTAEFLTTVEISYTQWSGLKTAEFTSSADSTFDFTREFFLENSLSGRVGAQYDFTTSFSLRGGFGYDISPFNSNHLFPQVPDANKIMFTVGAGFMINESIGIDLSAGMENYFERQGNEQASLLAGTYKTIRYHGGLAVSMQF